MWLSGLSAGLQTKGSPVRCPVRAHAWAAGQVGPPVVGAWEATTHWCFSASLSPSLPHCLKMNKWNLKKRNIRITYPWHDTLRKALYHFCSVLSQYVQLQSNHEITSDKSKLWGILQNNWPYASKRPGHERQVGYFFKCKGCLSHVPHLRPIRGQNPQPRCGSWLGINNIWFCKTTPNQLSHISQGCSFDFK